MVACGIQKIGEFETLGNATEKTKMHYAYANGLQQQSSDSVYSDFHKVPVSPAISLRQLKLLLLIFALLLLLAIAASATAVYLSVKNFNRGGGCDTAASERLGSNEPSPASGLGDGKQNIDDARQNITSTTVRHRPPQPRLASAHVSGADLTTDENYTVISDWRNTNSSDAFCSSIKHRNGRLIVLQAGFYYIYSKVQYLTYTKDDPGSTDLQLTHSVWRFNVVYSNGGYNFMMRSTVTARWPLGTDVDERTSYLGGVFALRAGDELFVRLSSKNVHKRPEATFFGLFSISGSGA